MPTPNPVDPTAPTASDNARIAQALREMAVLLQAQGGNPFRVMAYRRAADTVAQLPRPLREIHQQEGEAGLDALPGVGPRIAKAIAELLGSGRWQQLERLRGEADPDALLRTIPGVGAGLAQRLHDELGVQTLEALAQAANDGRLERLPRIGARRGAAIRSALAQMLDRQRALRRSRPAATDAPLPPVALLLDVDREYRAGAQAGTLPAIAPARFNPERRAWLPVLHASRPGWHVTALFSNTARAHELGHAHDWVVLYAEDDAHHEHQATVVTESRGALAGRRVVRGREAECRPLYTLNDAAAAAPAAPGDGRREATGAPRPARRVELAQTRRPGPSLTWGTAARHRARGPSPAQRRSTDSPHQEHTMYKRILVPLDGSPTSERGFEEAVALARMMKSTLLLVNIVDTVPMAIEMVNSTTWQDICDGMRKQGQGLLDRARLTAVEHGVASEIRLIEGRAERVADTIVNEARDTNCDLVVMGTHGRRGFAHGLLGSDAERVVRQSAVPVLLVRHPDAAKAR